MPTTTTAHEINRLMDSMERSFVLGIWGAVKIIWLAFWPYIIIFTLFILAGVVWQILIFQSGKRNRLSPGFNRLVGSLTYFFFFALIFIIAYWIFGTQVIDELWLAIFGAIAFPVTGLFLKFIGFCYY